MKSELCEVKTSQQDDGTKLKDALRRIAWLEEREVTDRNRIDRIQKVAVKETTRIKLIMQCNEALRDIRISGLPDNGERTKESIGDAILKALEYNDSGLRTLLFTRGVILFRINLSVIIRCPSSHIRNDLKHEIIQALKRRQEQNAEDTRIYLDELFPKSLISVKRIADNVCKLVKQEHNGLIRYGSAILVENNLPRIRLTFMKDTKKGKRHMECGLCTAKELSERITALFEGIDNIDFTDDLDYSEEYLLCRDRNPPLSTKQPYHKPSGSAKNSTPLHLESGVTGSEEEQTEGHEEEFQDSMEMNRKTKKAKRKTRTTPRGSHDKNSKKLDTRPSPSGKHSA